MYSVGSGCGDEASFRSYFDLFVHCSTPKFAVFEDGRVDMGVVWVPLVEVKKKLDLGVNILIGAFKLGRVLPPKVTRKYRLYGIDVCESSGFWNFSSGGRKVALLFYTRGGFIFLIEDAITSRISKKALF